MQKIFAVSILLTWIIGLFLPYEYGNDFDLEHLVDSYYVNYSWQTSSYYLFLIPGFVVIGISFSSYIAWRLFIIRFVLILFIPIFLVVSLNDSSFMSGGLYRSENGIGNSLNYLCFFATSIYGILHFRSSYPKFKQMLNEYQKEENDLLDN
ncbi:MAG: hypothetical protein IT221_08895 [Fluviicola sp.]|nr:hypothetical protein [Fluviicola sp.]